jgi:hypothetical protein
MKWSHKRKTLQLWARKCSIQGPLRADRQVHGSRQIRLQ